MLGRSTIEVIFTHKQLMKNTEIKGKILIWSSSNLKKDKKVSRDLILWVLHKRSILRGFSDIIKNIYKRVVTSVRTTMDRHVSLQ